MKNNFTGEEAHKKTRWPMKSENRSLKERSTTRFQKYRMQPRSVQPKDKKI